MPNPVTTGLHDEVWSIGGVPVPDGYVACRNCRQLLDREAWAAPCVPKPDHGPSPLLVHIVPPAARATDPLARALDAFGAALVQDFTGGRA